MVFYIGVPGYNYMFRVKICLMAMNIFIGLKMSMLKEHQDSIYDRGEQGAHGNGQDPGP